MKLPEELEKAWWNASLLGAQNDIIEAIVRDCAKVCLKRADAPWLIIICIVIAVVLAARGGDE